jgi:hypothetical protein
MTASLSLVRLDVDQAKAQIDQLVAVYLDVYEDAGDELFGRASSSRPGVSQGC